MHAWVEVDLTGVCGIPYQIWLPMHEAAPCLGKLPCTLHTDQSRSRHMRDFRARMASLSS